MRVLTGRLGGRLLESPRNVRTHPMADKVRGALFNILGDISELTVLDAFAGSGALSFEAISRGASHVVAVDIDKSAHAIILKNAHTLHVEAYIKSIRANVNSWSDNNRTARFDIVICDPPYDDIKPVLIKKLAQHVKINGILVLSLPPTLEFILPTDKFLLRVLKTYGDAMLVFYRRTA
jgi:16S rRNA (guanine966-N2)-methyltransferase